MNQKNDAWYINYLYYSYINYMVVRYLFNFPLQKLILKNTFLKQKQNFFKQERMVENGYDIYCLSGANYHVQGHTYFSPHCKIICQYKQYIVNL